MIFAQVNTVKYQDFLTVLPASLFCMFINARLVAEGSCPSIRFFSTASVNFLLNRTPYAILSLHPPQIQSLFSSFVFGVLPQPQCSFNRPILQA